MMTRNDLLNCILDDGVMEITTTYLRPDQQDKKDAAIKGFEICRGKGDDELLRLLAEGNACIQKAMDENSSKWYWHWIYYTRQIEWVLNVLSAAMHAHDRIPLTDFTLRGHLKAVDILGHKQLA